VEIFSEDVFEFREARIEGGDKGTGVGTVDGLRAHDGMRKEGMGNVFVNERWGITSGEVGFGDIVGVGMEVILVAPDSPPPDSEREKNGVFSG
jgi:hypothetical protein